MDIDDNEEYFGEYISTWLESYKGRYIITGLIQGKDNIAKNRVGRLVQIRKEAGDFGSDCVLIRHKDDSLVPHTNQSFWLIPEKFNEYLDVIFKDVYEDDADSMIYTLQGEYPEKGFIIESSVPDGESTPMRDIKNAIFDKLDKFL